MTESEWLNCSDRIKMLSFVYYRDHATERSGTDFPNFWEDGLGAAPVMRKMRLFVCACVGRDRYRLPDERSRRAVEVAERFAEGRAGLTELDSAWSAACLAAEATRGVLDAAAAASKQAEVTGRDTDTVEHIYQLALRQLDAAWDAAWAANRRIGRAACVVDADEAVGRREDLVRELWGNPFRPTVVLPGWLAWNGGTVPRLAQAIYEERAFDRIPLLADALEDAGCSDLNLLAHCRGPGPHLPGCWAVDQLLGKG